MSDHAMARWQRLTAWVDACVGPLTQAPCPLSTDASARRYWRVNPLAGGSWVAMDAPPEREDTRRYARLARAWRQWGLHTPDIPHADHVQGFLLIEDFGDCRYLDALDEARVERLYGEALETLATLQSAVPADGLPAYDGPFLRREAELFPQWLLEAYLGLALTPDEVRLLDDTTATLVASALEQPLVSVHRDYHSRNLMVLDRASPGVLDFQDAVRGPVTYDLVSLLRDCYIAWPPERVRDWALGYLRLARRRGILPAQEPAPETFLRWFDLMGAQRHLKAAGIFARLWVRDGKPGYLADLPRTLGYVVAVGAERPELAGLGEFLRRRVLPALAARSLDGR